MMEQLCLIFSLLMMEAKVNPMSLTCIKRDVCQSISAVSSLTKSSQLDCLLLSQNCGYTVECKRVLKTCFEDVKGILGTLSQVLDHSATRRLGFSREGLSLPRGQRLPQESFVCEQSYHTTKKLVKPVYSYQR